MHSRTCTDRATRARRGNFLPCKGLAAKERRRPAPSVRKPPHPRQGLRTAGSTVSGAQESHLWIRNSARSSTKGDAVSRILAQAPGRGPGALPVPVILLAPPVVSGCSRVQQWDGEAAVHKSRRARLKRAGPCGAAPGVESCLHGVGQRLQARIACGGVSLDFALRSTCPARFPGVTVVRVRAFSPCSIRREACCLRRRTRHASSKVGPS